MRYHALVDKSAYFKGKRITVMGLGLLGRGVGDAKYLAECGAELIVTDLKSKEELAESLSQLKEFKNISYTLGEHKLEDFRERDLILKAAGVPLDSIYISEAKNNNIDVRMSADLFMELSGLEAIGITGTRGKSTVTHMLAAILSAAEKKVLLGGNVRGVSTLALLKDAEAGDVPILELDSWQCQGLGEASLSPHIAVFTTFYDDHLNYYKDDAAQYLADKSNIFLYQVPDDTLVLGKQCAPMLIEKYGEYILANTVVADESKLPSDWKLQIPGVHNRYNAALALAAARASGIDDAISKKALEEFRGVPGRLELVREVEGVKYYNDTTATTPEATLAALEALDPMQEQNILLIIGGADKGLDMSKMREAIHTHAKDIFFLPGSGTDRVKADAPDKEIFSSLKDALEAAREAALPGDIILLSPAFASFGMFKNEFDRGDQYNALVNKL